MADGSLIPFGDFLTAVCHLLTAYCVCYDVPLFSTPII